MKRLFIKMIDIAEFSQAKTSCYHSLPIAHFIFNTTETLATHIGNFEAITSWQEHRDSINLYLFFDDNNMIYGEHTNIMVIQCNI